MGQLGLSSTRLRFEYIGAPMQAKLVDTLQTMSDKLAALGPNPAAQPRAGAEASGAW
jgi:coenzyme F420-reducing hydrogenase delta subunit